MQLAQAGFIEERTLRALAQIIHWQKSGEVTEVFSVFATMSLVDMLSNPVERINKKLQRGSTAASPGSASGWGR